MTAAFPTRTRYLVFLLLTCALVNLACLAYPIYVIRPFRAQGEEELQAALLITRFRPVVTAVFALVAAAAAVSYWHLQSRMLRRMLVAGTAGIVCLLAVMARVNLFEMMFHPVDRPSFSAAAKVKLDADEKVIAVKVAGEARAYPVRSISYHHVVNDIVGNKAIVATY